MPSFGRRRAAESAIRRQPFFPTLPFSAAAAIVNVDAPRPPKPPLRCRSESTNPFPCTHTLVTSPLKRFCLLLRTRISTPPRCPRFCTRPFSSHFPLSLPNLLLHKPSCPRPFPAPDSPLLQPRFFDPAVDPASSATPSFDSASPLAFPSSSTSLAGPTVSPHPLNRSGPVSQPTSRPLSPL